LEKEYAGVLAMDADTIDVTPIESSDEAEAAPTSGTEPEAGSDTET
jgi:hypothetical protein